MKKVRILNSLLFLSASAGMLLPLTSCRKEILVEEITIVGNNPIHMDRAKVLTVDISPADATDKTVTWSIDDDKVAQINPTTGEILGLKNGGTATVTATANDKSGKTATFNITVTDDPTAIDPATDPWSVFCLYANRGEEAFEEAYGLDVDDLIGKKWQSGTVKTLKRSVTLKNGIETSVRLIGVNHDQLSDGSGNKALFTFEFEDCLTEPIAFGNNAENIPYATSSVHDWCKNELNNLPDDLAKSIKEVVKDTYEYTDPDDEEAGEMVHSNEKLFPLSFFEAAGEEDPFNDPMKPLEGQPYQLYDVALYNGHGGRRGYVYNHEGIRQKKNIATEGYDWETYWLRSPYYVTYEGTRISGAYAVSESDGSAAGYYAYLPPYENFATYSIAPAFCI